MEEGTTEGGRVEGAGTRVDVVATDADGVGAGVVATDEGLGAGDTGSPVLVGYAGADLPGVLGAGLLGTVVGADVSCPALHEHSMNAPIRALPAVRQARDPGSPSSRSRRGERGIAQRSVRSRAWALPASSTPASLTRCSTIWSWPSSVVTGDPVTT